MASNQPPAWSEGHYPGYPPGPYYPGQGPQPGPPVPHEPQPPWTYGPPHADQLEQPSGLQPPPARRKKPAVRTLLVALLGLVFVPLGFLVVIGLVAALFAGPKPERAPTGVPESGAITEAGTLSALDLQPGDCYNTKLPALKPGETQLISTVEAVPCSLPHTHQIVTTITYSAQDSFLDTPTARAEEDCAAAFEQKLEPAAFDDPSLNMGTLSPPNEAEWRRTPTVACTLQSDQPATRSFVK